jgi:magnesium transporter
MAVTLYVYEPGKGTNAQENAQPDDVRAALEVPNGVVWIAAYGHEEGTREILREVLKLHELTVEDIIADLPHPKVEEFGHYLYIIAHGIDQTEGTPDSLQTIELDIVLGENFVFTHQSRPMRSVAAVQSEVARGCQLFEKGPAWIVHALLDHLIDHYLPLMDAFDDAIDVIEIEAVTEPNQAALRKIFSLKHSLMTLRRVAVHQREILLRLSRGEFHLVPSALLPFFRDVYDHFTRVADLCDSYRELVGGALDAYLTTVSNRMNEVMKVLTAIATIMLPLTFIAGLYGMNFEHMPELKWHYGYPFALVLMLAVAVFMLAYFKRKRWF